MSNGGFIGTAIQGALLRFEETLTVSHSTRTLAKGLTSEANPATKTCRGVIAYEERWKQLLVPGGEISASSPLLVVTTDLRDEDGNPLTITKDALITNEAGQPYRVVDRIGEGDRFGLAIYELTERRQ